MNSPNHILGVSVPKPEEEIEEIIDQFRSSVPTLEESNNLPFIILQDGKSQAYYIECHMAASDAIPLVDFDAVLDPEEQEQFRLQRELQPTNIAFLKMCSDALENRQFSDLIAEYDLSYRPETPLKLLGGQHRAEAIKRALESNEVSRCHGFRVYFGLTIDQRNEIAQIANTNIAISPDLLDRMQETVRGPQLRGFCHRVGLLDSNEDFADRKTSEGRITVRLARTFIVDFFKGQENRDGDLEKSEFVPYICKSGQEDPEYLSIISNIDWMDKGLVEAGENFANLHKKQIQTVEQDPELNKTEFRNKAMSMAVLSSWAFVAGLLQDKKDALNKFYSLPKFSGDKDPLVAKYMSESSHPKDPPTYRGLGVRYSVEDRGRVTEMFIQYSLSDSRRITKVMIDSAIASYEAKVAIKKAREAREKVR